jgi:hypothetical protein
MKRAIITAFAAIGLSSIAGISFAETELSSAQLDNVTAAGGSHSTRPSSFTFQKQSQSNYQANYCKTSQCSNQSSQTQAGNQSGFANTAVAVGSPQIAVQLAK